MESKNISLSLVYPYILIYAAIFNNTDVIIFDTSSCNSSVNTSLMSIQSSQLSQIPLQQQSNVKFNTLGLCLNSKIKRDLIFSYSISTDLMFSTFEVWNKTNFNNNTNINWIPYNLNISSISLDEFYVTNVTTSAKFGVGNVVFDTSASMIMLPHNISNDINTLLGFTYDSNSKTYTALCSSIKLNTIPNSLQFQIQPQNGTLVGISLNIATKLLIHQQTREICFSSIIDGDTIVLGNAFLRNYYTYFNNINGTIGFVQKEKLLINFSYYPAIFCKECAVYGTVITIIAIVLLVILGSSISYAIFCPKGRKS